MACDFISLATSGVQGLTPYRPGNAGTLGVDNLLMLASNENPLGAGECAQQAVAAHLSRLQDYPDPSGYALKTAIAERFGLAYEQITLGNGSNDVLDLIARAFLAPGDEAIYAEYGFLVYPIVVQAIGATGVQVPAKDWGHDLPAMAAAVTAKTKVIFLANPNNPTGTWFDGKAFAEFMASVPESVVVVLDEAYTEFNDDVTVNGLDLVAQYSNLVVTRSFSKAHGLAALRAGFAVANAQITDLLNRVRQPFNMNTLAIYAAAAALFDDAHLAASATMNAQGMAQLMQGFTSLGLAWIPSKANFLTLEVGPEAAKIAQKLKERGVFVRPLDNYNMPQHLRITIGLPEQNERLLDTLAQVIKEVDCGH